MDEATFEGWETDRRSYLEQLEKLETASVKAEGSDCEGDDWVKLDERQRQQPKRQRQKKYSTCLPNPHNYSSWSVQSLKIELRARGLKPPQLKADCVAALDELIATALGDNRCVE